MATALARFSLGLLIYRTRLATNDVNFSQPLEIWRGPRMPRDRVRNTSWFNTGGDNFVCFIPSILQFNCNPFTVVENHAQRDPIHLFDYLNELPPPINLSQKLTKRNCQVRPQNELWLFPVHSQAKWVGEGCKIENWPLCTSSRPERGPRNDWNNYFPLS